MNKNIIKRFILFSILILSFSKMQAKTYDHVVQGRVVDNMTGLGMSGILVKLMTEDSMIIDIGWVRSGEMDAGLYQLMVHKVGRYIIKAECKGYNAGYTEFNLRSNRQSTLFPSKIYLTKISHDLPEVVVKATKVKMIMQGDTIIYNADAFNLAEGSMLDELITHLPGAKLNKNGQIFVNGKYIQSLLVNGKDFFSGNPKIALENLLAYTVSKIKVYHKEGAMSRLRSKNMGDDSYVMNVSLKRVYSRGYIENLETGLGTKNRYRAKALGILFTDVDRTLFYANMNNLNDKSACRT